MASQETERKLRIADGLVVIALAAVSLLAIWRTAPEVWFGVLQSLMPALLVVLGGVILVGKTRAGRLLRTRRRWRYFALIGVVSAVIMTVALTSLSSERQGGSLALVLFPAFIGLFVAQLYEPEKSAQFKAADLSDRDAKTWKRIALVPAVVVGIILGCIAGVTVAADDTGTGFLLLPIALLFLVFAAAIWMMLRSRNRQLRAKP